MSVDAYRITCKSEELRGAGQPNILELGFDTDADAITFGANLQQLIGGTVVSIDKTIQENFALPYPAGTNQMTRLAMFDGVSHWSNQAIKDIKAGFVDTVRGPALIAAGAQIWNQITGQFYVPTVINCTVFTPQASF